MTAQAAGIPVMRAARHMARMSEAIHPEAQLEWLKKSERNPFGVHGRRQSVRPEETARGGAEDGLPVR